MFDRYISRSSRSPSHFRVKITAAILWCIFLENGAEFGRKVYICEILLAELFLSVPTLWGLSPLLIDLRNRWKCAPNFELRFPSGTTKSLDSLFTNMDNRNPYHGIPGTRYNPDELCTFASSKIMFLTHSRRTWSIASLLGCTICIYPHGNDHPCGAAADRSFLSTSVLDH